jgi:hypothetical protein
MVWRNMLGNKTIANDTTTRTGNTGTIGSELITSPSDPCSKVSRDHENIEGSNTFSNIVSPDISSSSSTKVTTLHSSAVVNCNKNLFQQAVVDSNLKQCAADDDNDINSVASSSYTANDQSVGQQTYEIPQYFHGVISHRNDSTNNRPNINVFNTMTTERISSYDITNNANTAHSTTTGYSSIDGGSSSYCSTSSDDMMLFQSGCKLEPILVSSLLPEDSNIVDRLSFDLQNYNDDDDNGSTSTSDRNSIINNSSCNNNESVTINKCISESLESSCTTAKSKQDQECITVTVVATLIHQNNSEISEKKIGECVSTSADVKRPAPILKSNRRSLLEDESESSVGFNMSTSCDTIALSSVDGVHLETDDGDIKEAPAVEDPHSLYNQMVQDQTVQQQQIQDVQLQEQQQEPPDFALGDHVYQWCSFAGIPRVYQHHGIILDVYYCKIEHEWILKIVDFSSWDLQQEQEIQEQQRDQDHLTHTMSTGDEGGTVSDDFSVMTDVTNMSTTTTITTNRRYNGKSVRKKSFIRSNCKSGGCIRIYESVVNDNDSGRWHKVRYNAGFWSQQIGRSGTCTSSECDPPGIVRARAQFIINHPYMIPSYSAVRSNCECVAVWCKTGTWCTLQAISWLHGVVVSQAKQAATIAGVATAATVTVPASGMWGWLGYTTTVSLVSTQPLLLPAIATYGVITTVGPALWLIHAKKHWKALTERLNTSFWEDAVNHPDIFVECITHWAISNDGDMPYGNATINNSQKNDASDCVTPSDAPIIPIQLTMSSASKSSVTVSHSINDHTSVSPLKDEYSL